MPGLIEQHLHPILSALSLTSEVIANDEWELPGRLCKAATSPEEFIARLRAAVERPSDGAFFFAWGYHQLWHGALSRGELDAISATRPIAVWHRSMQEF